MTSPVKKAGPEELVKSKKARRKQNESRGKEI